MSENSREQISALVDDELETGSIFLLNAMKDNQEYRRAWLHYHLIGETLRGNLPAHVDLKLADRISSAIRDEPGLPTASGKLSYIFRPVAGFAIAASVTVVAILGIRQASLDAPLPAAPVVASSAPAASTAPVASAAVTESADVRFTSANTTGPENKAQDYLAPIDAESRLNRYLVNYNEYRNNVGVQGMLPYVRIVTHEVEE